MKPDINETINGYSFSWSEEQIDIGLCRIRQHSDGSVKGEITVTTTAPNYNPHLYQGQFNLVSLDAQKKLVKELSARYSENNISWLNIIEQFRFHALQRVREGEPVVELWTSDDMTPPEYLLKPFLIKNYPTIFFGDPSSAKSTIAIVLSTLMTLPWCDNPLGIDVPEYPRSVLWLDYETDEDTVKWQTSCIQRGMDLPSYAIHYRHCSQPLFSDIEQVQKAIMDKKADIIVIDSIGLACGGELKEAAPVLTFFSALRKLKITSLILAHTSKDKESKSKTPYGSIFFEAYARSIWELRKVQEADENELQVCMYHKKPPPFGKLHKPLGFKMCFNHNKTIVSPQDPRTVGEFMERMSTQQRILNVLKEGAFTPKEIAEKIGVTDSSGRMALKRLKDKGKVLRLGEKYGLSTEYEL